MTDIWSVETLVRSGTGALKYNGELGRPDSQRNLVLSAKVNPLSAQHRFRKLLDLTFKLAHPAGVATRTNALNLEISGGDPLWITLEANSER
jgi:hypothetical protein